MGLFNFPQVDSNVNVIFSVDGDEYAVEQFKIGFHQPVDNLKLSLIHISEPTRPY